MCSALVPLFGWCAGCRYLAGLSAFTWVRRFVLTVSSNSARGVEYTNVREGGIMSGRKNAVLTLAAAAALACHNEPLSPESRTGLAEQVASDQSASGIVGPSVSGTGLPFRGSYTINTNAVFTPPSTLTIDGTATGAASHLGRFTATTVDVVNTTTATSTGTYTLTAANGDQLFATTAGGEDQFIPPNVSHVTLVATIVGGTGRFASATGTFTIRFVSVLDFATATSSGSGAFDGRINLNK